MHPRVPALLWEAREACAAMSEFVSEKRYDDYLTDEMLQGAVQISVHRASSNLTGAAGHDPLLVESLPEIQPLLGIGDAILRDYRNPDHPQHWDIASRIAPGLAIKLQAMLDTVPV